MDIDTADRPDGVVEYQIVQEEEKLESPKQTSTEDLQGREEKVDLDLSVASHTPPSVL